VCEAFFKALAAGDVDTAYSLMADSKRSDIRNEIEKMSQNAKTKKLKVSVAEEKVIEDAAAVVVTFGERKPMPIWAARVNDEWKLLLEHPEDFNLTDAQLDRLKQLKTWFTQTYGTKNRGK
jgi:hypothetical protein